MKLDLLSVLVLIWMASATRSSAAVETFMVERTGKPARITAAIDSKGVLHRGAEYGTNPIPWLADRTKSVAAAYPYMERMRHHTGSGVFRVFVDLKTGSVTKVAAIKSTGFKRLDDSAVASLRQWRWKPGTWQQIDMPVTFTIAVPPKRAPAGVERIPKAH